MELKDITTGDFVIATESDNDEMPKGTIGKVIDLDTDCEFNVCIRIYEWESDDKEFNDSKIGDTYWTEAKYLKKIDSSPYDIKNGDSIVMIMDYESYGKGTEGIVTIYDESDDTLKFKITKLVHSENDPDNMDEIEIGSESSWINAYYARNLDQKKISANKRSSRY